MTTNPRDNISQKGEWTKNSVKSMPLKETLTSLVRKVTLTPEPDMEK